MKLEYLNDGSGDCPLVRLYDLDPQGVKLFVKHLYDLSTKKIESFEVHTIPGIEQVDNLRLKAVVGKDQGVVLHGPGLNFEMTLSQASWGQVAGLAEPFEVQEGGGRHQWLDNTSGIQLLISSHRNGTW